MAQKEKNILKKYFRKGEYPTESQFSDLIDSLRHFSDEILLSDVTGLNKALNTKFNVSEGEALKKELSAQKNDIDDVSNVCENLSDNLKLLETFVGDSRDLEPDGGALTLNIHNLWQSLTNLKRDEIEPLKTEVNIVAGIASKAREMASTNAANISSINQRIEQCLTLDELLPVTEKQIDKALEPIDERIEKLENKPAAVTQKRKPSGILHLAPMSYYSEPGEVYLSTKMVIKIPYKWEDRQLSLSKLFPDGIPNGLEMEILDYKSGTTVRYDAGDNCLYWDKYVDSEDNIRYPKVIFHVGVGVLACWMKDKNGAVRYYDKSYPQYTSYLTNLVKLKSKPVSLEDFGCLIKDKQGYSHTIQVQRRIRIAYKRDSTGKWQFKRKWSTVLSCNYNSYGPRFSKFIKTSGVYRARRKTKRQDWSDWRYFFYSHNGSGFGSSNGKPYKEI